MKDWRGVLSALILLLLVWAPGAHAQNQCTQYGGYPWVQNGCLNAGDINFALNQSWGNTPPQNSLGQGAGIGKFWVDTSTGTTTPTLRQCINPSGCSSVYISTDWLNWGIYNTVNPTFAFASSISASLSLGTTAPLSYSGGVLSLSAGAPLVVNSSGDLIVAPAGITSSMLASGAAAANLGSSTANSVLATPNGSSGTGAYRALVAADLPSDIPSSLLASGALANGMTATTQALDDTSTKLATDQFVGNAFASPPPVGATAPNTGAFTTLTTNTVGSVFGTDVTGGVFGDATLLNVGQAGNYDSFICGVENNLAADTEDYPTACTAFAKLAAGSSGNSVFASASQVWGYAPGVYTNEHDSFSENGAPPTTWPPDRAFGTTQNLAITLTLGASGSYMNYAALELVQDGLDPQPYEFGLLTDPDAFGACCSNSTYGIAITADADGNGPATDALLQNTGGGINLTLQTTGSMTSGNSVMQVLDASSGTHFALRQNGDILANNITPLSDDGEDIGGVSLRYNTVYAENIQTNNGTNSWNFALGSGSGNVTLGYDGGTDVTVYTDGGVTIGSPTGGDKGAGTINVASGVYLNGTAYTNP